MSEPAFVVKIKFTCFYPNYDHSEDLIRNYIGHEIIAFSNRMDAGRFIYELYESHDASGLGVKDDKKFALGVETDEFIYQLIG